VATWTVSTDELWRLALVDWKSLVWNSENYTLGLVLGANYWEAGGDGHTFGKVLPKFLNMLFPVKCYRVSLSQSLHFLPVIVLPPCKPFDILSDMIYIYDIVTMPSPKELGAGSATDEANSHLRQSIERSTDSFR
jgi:hypothetical protein